MMKLYDELLQRGLIAQTTDEEKIRELIDNGKAVFYIGVDPTAGSLHIGHFLTLTFLKRLQMGGNKPIIVLGGGTGYVGDPSGRTDMRKVLSPKDIEHNCECFKHQMEKFVDFSSGKALLLNNKDWLLNLKYIDFIREIGPYFSVNTMLRADCYKERMQRGLSFLELNYMPMQSYDFYFLFKNYGCNMQFGGDDQWSNMLGGTELIRRKLGKDAYALTIPLLLNREGKKMGKTAKGAIWLDEKKTSPFEFYQYWRNVDDKEVIRLIKMLTFIPLSEIKKMEKWEGVELNKAKDILAYEVTKLVHGEEKANKAKNATLALFGGGTNEEDVPTAIIDKKDLTDDSISLIELLNTIKLCKSKSDARRLILEGGISVGKNKIKDPSYRIYKKELNRGIKIKKGKKTFIKVFIKK